MKAPAICAVVCALAGVAAADPTVVVVQTRDAPTLPSLQVQLELHAPRVVVERRADPDADPLTFAGRAAAIVGGQDRIVIWIARVGDGYLVFAAGPWPDRALIELVHVDAAIDAAELERTLALKIAGLVEALEVLRTARPAVPTVELVPVAPIPRRWVIEVAGGIARDAHERGTDARTALGVGLRWRRGGWAATAGLVVHWQPGGTIDGEHGRVTVGESGIGIAPELARELGRVAVYGRLHLAIAADNARGESEDGRTGSAIVLTPYAGVAVGIRLRLAPTAAIGASTGIEAAAVRRELLVDDETVVDAGRFRWLLALSLNVEI